MVRKNSYIYLRKRWYDIISESGKDYLYFGIKKTRILMICVSFVLSRKYNDLKKGKAFHNPQFFVAYNLCNPMFGEAFRFVIDKRKTPAFHILFQYARQSLASNCDIAKRYAEQTSAIYATMNRVCSGICSQIKKCPHLWVYYSITINTYSSIVCKSVNLHLLL